MEASARPAVLDEILDWRDAYRLEMDCQIIHDSIHYRPGWTREYVLCVGTTPVGYGSVAIGGPWAAQPTVYEFYVAPDFRSRMREAFKALLKASGSECIEVQSNDLTANAMLNSFARESTSLSVLFADKRTTRYSPPGAIFREPTSSESPDIPREQLRWHGIVEVEGQVAAKGGILFHYNPPYGDIFMEVSVPFRRRGLGSFVVQELKRICYEGGHIPGARCNPDNVASRKTLLKAGFNPCGHMLHGKVSH